MEIYTVETQAWNDFFAETVDPPSEGGAIVHTDRYLRFYVGNTARSRRQFGSKIQINTETVIRAALERDVDRMIARIAREHGGVTWVWVECLNNRSNDMVSWVKARNNVESDDDESDDGTTPKIDAEVAMMVRDTRKQNTELLSTVMGLCQKIIEISDENTANRVRGELASNRDLEERRTAALERFAPHAERALTTIIAGMAAKATIDATAKPAETNPERVARLISEIEAGFKAIIATYDAEKTAITDEQITRMQTGLALVGMGLANIQSERKAAK